MGKRKKIVIASAVVSIVAITIFTGIKSSAADKLFGKSGDDIIVYDDNNLVTSEYGTGLLEPNAKEKKWVEENVQEVNNVNELEKIVKESNLSETSNTSKGIKAGADGDTPVTSSVDNSLSKYAPSIGDQKRLSACTAYSMIYYQQTYMLNRASNQQVSMNNTMSAIWTYALINGGKNSGTYASDAATIAKYIGGVDKTLVSNNADEANIMTWNATEDIWKSASANKISDYYELKFKDDGSTYTWVTSPDDTSLATIKKALSMGEVLSFSTPAYGWNTARITDNDSKYYGQYVIVSTDVKNSSKAGWHRCVIVGYDDTVWYDYNNNNVKDKGELGAFKVANSWGDDWGNNGYVWITYDSLNKISSVDSEKRSNASMQEIYGYIVNDRNDTDYYAVFTLNTSKRNTVDIKLNYTAPNTPTHTYDVLPFSGVVTGGEYNFEGKAELGDGTFVVDLNNVVANLTQEQFLKGSWSIEITDLYNDAVTLTAKNIKLIDKKANKEYYSDNANIAVNGKSQTTYFDMNPSESKYTTIYYSGYSSPYIHYKVGDEGWTTAPGVKMTETNEVKGYTHKIKINMKKANSLTACFNDGNGNWDSNDGKNYTFNVGTYTYKSGKVTPYNEGGEGNKLTLYYKGFENPYIHYKIGNGAWTATPGKLLDKTNELDSYTHKTVIDLGTESDITACFNDGNGNWDSNYGNNYVFGSGTYTYIGGKITKIK